MLWHILYGYFVFTVFYTDCPWKHPTAGGSETGRTTGVTTRCFVENGATQIALGVVCWILGLLFLAKELFEMFTVPSKLRYFMEMENIGQLAICLSVGITSWPVLTQVIGGTNEIPIGLRLLVEQMKSLSHLGSTGLQLWVEFQNYLKFCSWHESFKEFELWTFWMVGSRFCRLCARVGTNL